MRNCTVTKQTMERGDGYQMKYNNRAYSQAYTVLASITKKYYPLCNRNKFYERELIDEFRCELANLEKVYRPDFPSEFYGRAANTIIHWFLNEFKGIHRGDLIPALQNLWKFHKKYLNSDFTNEDLEAAFNHVSKLKDNIATTPEELKLYTAVLEDLERVHAHQEEVTETAPAEQTAPQAAVG